MSRLSRLAGLSLCALWVTAWVTACVPEDVNIDPDPGDGGGLVATDPDAAPDADQGASADETGAAEGSSGGGDDGNPATDATTPSGRDASMPGADGNSQTDGGADVGPDSMCVATIPPGWSPAIYNTALDACPAGFTEHVVLGTPTVVAGACSCACSVTQPGACGGQGSLTLSEAPGHGVDTCTVPWFTTTLNGSQCIGVPAASQGAFEAYLATGPSVTAQGGACSSQAASNPAALSEPPQRFCDVPAASADAVCAGSAPAGFSACIVAAGKLACPSSTPFVHPFTVEDSATVSCGSCSPCSVSTTCGSPTIAAFTAANCAAPAAVTFNVGGSCVGTGNEITILSILYSATPSSTCTAGSSSANVILAGEKTICCR